MSLRFGSAQVLGSFQFGVGFPVSLTPPDPSALWQVAHALALNIASPSFASPLAGAASVAENALIAPQAAVRVTATTAARRVWRRSILCSFRVIRGRRGEPAWASHNIEERTGARRHGQPL